MSTFGLRTALDVVIDTYLECVRHGVCPDCLKAGKPIVRFAHVDHVNHTFIARPCGHVLAREFGHHRDPEPVRNDLLEQLRKRAAQKRTR